MKWGPVVSVKCCFPPYHHQGTDYVFANTISNYADNGESEERQGKLLVDAAKEQNVKYFIYRYALTLHPFSSLTPSQLAGERSSTKQGHSQSSSFHLKSTR